VVTEFGIAYLFGKSVRERATALIEIAHPDFRESLLDEAKRQSLAPSAAFDPVGILNPGRMYAGI
jgi:acyl-CoA hydrolase